MTAFGCPVRGILSVTSISGNSKNALLCCDKSKEKDACFTPAPCLTFSSLRFDEAKKICEDEGHRLCLKEEIERGDCCKQECDFDQEKVWILDEIIGEKTLMVTKLRSS